VVSIIKKKALKLERLIARINVIVREEVIKERDLIIKMNREQLRLGKKADGSRMPKYVKNSKQPSAPGPITLFDKGEFHAGIDTLFDDVGIELIGTDVKTPFLLKYGNILGLTTPNIKKLQNTVRPHIMARIRKLLI